MALTSLPKISATARVEKGLPRQAATVSTSFMPWGREAIRLETIARSTNVIWRLVSQVEEELTPEQRRAFEAMKPKASELTLDVLKVKPAAEPKP